MGDENGRPVLRDMVQLLIDLIFRLRVQSGRGLIQDQYRSLSVQGPGYGDLLGLPAGDFHPLRIKVLIKGSLQVHARKPRPETGLLQRSPGPLPVIDPAARQILPQPEGEQLEILEHHAEQLPADFLVQLPDVPSVHQDLPPDPAHTARTTA